MSSTDTTIAAPLRGRTLAPLNVLWVDDDTELTAELACMLADEGYRVECAETLAEARTRLAAGGFDLVIVDLALPDGSGFSLIRDGSSNAGEFVILTGHRDVDSAVEAMRHQVFDYLTKPLDLAELRTMLGRVRNGRRVRGSPSGGPAARAGESQGDAERRLARSLIGSSASVRAVRNLILRAADSEITVFLSGESGTGKEVAARCLHELSARASGPFVAVNCGALAPSLVASELFGHERGSFTGAHRAHAGVFERARGGTLFLDEVTEMPIDLQAHLLRVIETGTVIKVGGTQEIAVDARVIAATNRDPLECVERGELRRDLYYRLQVFPVALPPLRERRGDIPELAEQLIEQTARRAARRCRLSARALEVLQGHSWPGNVRELRNVIERACLLSDGVIEPEHLLIGGPRGPTGTGPEPDWRLDPLNGMTLREAELELIRRTLSRCDNNRTRAAALLGISVKTLYNKLARDARAP